MTVQAPVWAGRGHVSTFVRSLHLLDLDELPDWPEVTLQTLGAKASLQHRIRCVEWSLYRLFDLLMLKKLRPFFPPTTSLQSVNLRAALLRQLTELKKDGVLGQHVTLRKTMLDECKGEKFEELLAAFSMIVLRKTREVRPSTDAVAAQAANIVPLIVSYRKAIQRDLDARRELKLEANQQRQSLDASISALISESNTARRMNLPDILENADDMLKKMVRESWIGDHVWVDTVLSAIPGSASKSIDNTDTNDFDHDPSILLADLSSRVRVQDHKLAQWRSYLNTLQEWKREKPVNQTKSIVSKLHPRTFDKHQTLVVDHSRVADEEYLIPRHASLLESLSRELGAKPSPDPVSKTSHRPVVTAQDCPLPVPPLPAASAALANRAAR